MRHFTAIALLCLLGASAWGQAPPQPTLPVVNESLSIAQAVDMATRQSPSLAAAREDVAVARAAVTQARAQTAPRVEADYNLAAGPGMIMPGPSTQLMSVSDVGQEKAQDFKGILQWPIYTGGRLQAEIARAQANTGVATAGLETTRRNVILEVQRRYYGALQAAALTQVAREALAQAQEELRVAEVRFAAGKIPRVDLLRAQAEAADRTRQLIAAQNAETIALAELKTSMGISPQSKITFTDTLAYAAPTETLETSLAAAAANRPELRANEQQIAAQRAGVRAARAEYRPSIYLNLAADLRVPGDDNDPSGVTILASAALPVLDAGLRRGRVQEAQAMLRRAEATRQQTRLTVALDVTRAFSNLQAADAMVKASEAAVTQSQEAYSIAQLRYTSGKGTYLELLDARTALVHAQTNRITALAQYNTARAELARAVSAP